MLENLVYTMVASLKPEAVQGTIKEGGTLESFHFAFGETDIFLIADIPDVPTATV